MGAATNNESERRCIIALLSYHPNLEPLSFIGVLCQVMQMNNEDIQQYQVGYFLETRSFLSSSIDQKVADLFLCQQITAESQVVGKERTKLDSTLIKVWMTYKYRIKHRRTTLHIEGFSQYAIEGEVSIMAYFVL